VQSDFRKHSIQELPSFCHRIGGLLQPLTLAIIAVVAGCEAKFMWLRFTFFAAFLGFFVIGFLPR
jgi:hypothetical protein